MNDLSSALAFDLGGDIKSIELYGDGHINDTYLVTLSAEKPRFILQRVNQNVFKEPVKVMKNIIGVTEYIRKKVSERGGDISREVLNVIKTKKAEDYFVDAENKFWRCYLFVEDTCTYQLPNTPELFYESARAFGGFGSMLRYYPADTLYETIMNFHNTPWRYEQLNKAVELNAFGRLKEVTNEVKFCLERAEEAATMCTMQKSGTLPIRVTHNDTKLNNVLLDAKTNKGICVIDLDTVMPGLYGNDFGDSIRFGANTAAEDEVDLEKCTMSLEMFEAFTDGYLETAGDALTDCEVKTLSLGAKLMTLECGVRFLTDYLSGDVYFKIHREKQNLDRCRTQLKMVADMENKWDNMEGVISRLAERKIYA